MSICSYGIMESFQMMVLIEVTNIWLSAKPTFLAQLIGIHYAVHQELFHASPPWLLLACAP